MKGDKGAINKVRIDDRFRVINIQKKVTNTFALSATSLICQQHEVTNITVAPNDRHFLLRINLVLIKQ